MLLQEIVEALPKMMSRISAPLAQAGEIVFVNPGGMGEGTASSLVALPQILEAVTGVDLREALFAACGEPANLRQAFGIRESQAPCQRP